MWKTHRQRSPQILVFPTQHECHSGSVVQSPFQSHESTYKQILFWIAAISKAHENTSTLSWTHNLHILQVSPFCATFVSSKTGRAHLRLRCQDISYRNKLKTMVASCHPSRLLFTDSHWMLWQAAVANAFLSAARKTKKTAGHRVTESAAFDSYIATSAWCQCLATFWKSADCTQAFAHNQLSTHTIQVCCCFDWGSCS